MDPSFEKKLLTLQKKDGRYSLQAYFFVFEALEYTICKLGRQAQQGEERHISGRELLNGIRDHARDQYGPLAGTVFSSWGISKTEDFGEIVFRLVEGDLLKKRDCDRREDFSNGFNFKEAFEENYRIDLSQGKS